MGILIDSSILIAHERGRLNLERELSGREEEDVFLSVITAATALSNGLIMATGNLREFKRVPGLAVESW